MKAACWGLLLILCTLATTGCGGGGGKKLLDIADIGWTENTAIAQLTKVLLEEELGYEEVTIHTSDLDSVYDSVAKGDLKAFQDVWLPNQRDLLKSVEGDVVQLSYSYQGQTKQGVAVPTYMDITSLEQLNDSNADLILGIEPSSVVMGKIYDEVLPAYGLHQQLVGAPTEGMLAEIDDRYRNREEFAFVAWSPHWMNQRYDIRYLEDPKNAFGELNEPARISTIVNKDLPKNDPEATAFMNALTLDEEQIGELEGAINDAGEPHDGANEWVQDNRDVWQSWVEAAQNARQGGTEKQEAKQDRQESTPHAAQRTQQEPNQQDTQTTPSTTQSGDSALRLIGVWDATSIQGESVAPGTQTLTFSDDGSLRATFDDGFSSADTMTQYTVLDDSRMESIDPDDGTPIVATYSLEGDTLTLESKGAQGLPATYQRTG